MLEGSAAEQVGTTAQLFATDAPCETGVHRLGQTSF